MEFPMGYAIGDVLFGDQTAEGASWYHDPNIGTNPLHNFGYYSEIFYMPEVPRVEVEEDTLKGKEPLVQTFYEGPESEENRINWIEKEPGQIPAGVKAKYNQVAIRVYKTRCRGDERGKRTFGGVATMDFDSIEIQSPIIIAALEPIMTSIGAFLGERDVLQFRRPFKSLYFAHAKIIDFTQTSDVGSEVRQHMQVLVDTMDLLFKDTMPLITQLHTKRLITCSLLWTLFPKDILVYSQVDGQDRLYQLRYFEFVPQTQCRKGHWVAACHYVQFDGLVYGMAEEALSIEEFHGTVPITDLSVYPIGFHVDKSLETRLVERGKQVLAFQGIGYWEYAGIAKADEDDVDNCDTSGKPSSCYVTGRVITDALGFVKYSPYSVIETKPLDLEAKVTAETKGKGATSSIRSSHQTEAFHEKKRPSAEEQKKNRERLLDPENRQYLLLMSPMIPGFTLRLKKWLWFRVDCFQHISFNEQAYDYLILPDYHKELILTLVQRHEQAAAQNDNIIAGKGQGLIVLLTGPPGTGKTLTAEAVADRIRRPIYYLNPEDLGAKEGAIGRNFQRACELAIEWNAILLLDEADVFITKRSVTHSDHNSTVATFLHHLEYYRGIIFLTTNLSSNIDPAFQSRIQILLRFPELSKQSRLKLWETFIARINIAAPSSAESRFAKGRVTSPTAVNISLSAEDRNALSTWRLNGREIQNVIRTAQQWCSYKRLELTMERVEAAIDVTAPWAEKETSKDERPSKRQRTSEEEH